MVYCGGEVENAENQPRDGCEDPPIKDKNHKYVSQARADQSHVNDSINCRDPGCNSGSKLRGGECQVICEG